MEKTTVIRTRVPARRLKSAEGILAKLGLKPDDAVNILMAQIVRHKGLPFAVRLNDEPLLTTTEQGAEWEAAFGAY